MKQKSELTPEATQAFQRLGMRLLKARKIRGWSREATAARCGINRNTLRTLEQGETVNTAVLLKVLCLYDMTDELDLLAQPQNDRLGQALVGGRNQIPNLDDNF